jgi:alginate O-acetyltransferase complex protein AlgI
MIFSSFIFIFGFLPIVLTLYFILPAKLKNVVLLLSSFVFYAWGAPEISILLTISCLADFYLVKIMNNKINNSRKIITFAAIAINLSILAYFKYANFFVNQISYIRSFLGFQVWQWQEIILPIGISFFTFHKISYIFDVYKKTTPPAKYFSDYFLFIIFFPQLIAGPILRYQDIDKQITARKTSLALFTYGIIRFSIGLSKKILLADSMGAVAENVFSINPENLNMLYAWIGALSYTFQIYFDFSGYSDMAIGLCAMFGFKITENFNMPYKASSVTEFWQRWHISLSLWMREYLYIPLGGNRLSKLKTARNLWIVFLLSGLWHGANWTFVIWGTLHGLLMSLERLYLTKIKLPKFLGRAYTLLFIILTWVIFRAENISYASNYFRALFIGNNPITSPVIGLIINERGRFFFLVCLSIVIFSWNLKISKFTREQYEYPLKNPWIIFIFSYILFLLSVLTLSTSTFSPFIYYQF